MLLLYEYSTKTVVLRIMNITLMNFSLLPCGSKHMPFFFKLFIGFNFIEHKVLNNTELPLNMILSLNIPCLPNKFVHYAIDGNISI